MRGEGTAVDHEWEGTRSVVTWQADAAGEEGPSSPAVRSGLRDNSQIPVRKGWVEGGTLAKKPREEECTLWCRVT